MERMGRGGRWARRRLPLVGLLLVLAFLGHDLLMAAEAHADGAVAHRAGGVLAASLRSTAAAERAAAALMPGDPAPEAVVPAHPADCGVVRFAAAPEPRSAGFSPCAAGPAAAPTLAVGRVVLVVAVPVAPAGRRRAALQVWRI